MIKRLFLGLSILLFSMSLGACTKAAREGAAKNICDGVSNCSFRCPDGTITDANYPKCPINDRDLLPPQNDNVGLEGLDGMKRKR